ncbi:MAG: sugar ABC transporter permease [Chloroflexi bacterium]|nr:MAG: sugar ABC transporter permease [Chloroflexota bacterium]
MIAALTRRRSPSDLSITNEQRFYAGVFLLPTVLIALGLIAYPLIYSLLLTVRGEGDLPGELGPWIGLINWTHLPGDPVFRQSFIQSVMYVVPACVAGVIIALGAAVVLNQDFPGRRIARACLLIPWALPPVVVAAMFEWFLDARRGLLGAWLTNLGITTHPPAFFGGIPGTLFTLVGIHVWKTFPLLAIMFLVALQYLPQETLHAARIDGANMLKRFRYVVLPHLRPTIIAAVVIELLITLQLFDLIYALTLGGPGAYSTYNLYFYAYKNTFEYQDFGYGAVLAYIVSALVIIFALILTRWRSARGQLVAG